MGGQGRMPTMIEVAQLCGERDGFKQRATMLAGEVRKTTVSMHSAQSQAREATAEREKLRELLGEVYACRALHEFDDLRHRVGVALGLEEASPDVGRESFSNQA